MPQILSAQHRLAPILPIRKKAHFIQFMELSVSKERQGCQCHTSPISAILTTKRVKGKAQLARNVCYKYKNAVKN